MCRYWDTSQQTLCRSCVRKQDGCPFGYTTDAKGGFTAVMLVVAGAVIWGVLEVEEEWNLTREPEAA